jgi:hypothetical protein
MEAFAFLLTIFILISFTGFFAFKIHNKVRKQKKKKERTFLEFINRGKIPEFKQLLIGASFGIVFGFIDNAGLWFGMSALDKYLPGGPLTKAALGNTFSDILGATFGSFISIILFDLVKYDDDDQPIWTNAIGIVIGCLIGLYIPRLITGKT